MASSLGEFLAEHEEFVREQLDELRTRLLAEHKRQVSLLWNQLPSEGAVGRPSSRRGSRERAGSRRGSSEKAGQDSHQITAASVSNVISVHQPPQEPTPPNRKQSCPHPPLDLHPAALGVIGEAEELGEELGARRGSDKLENCASFISISSSDGGGLEVGCFDFSDPNHRGSLDSSCSASMRLSKGLQIQRPQANSGCNEHSSKPGQARPSIHVHYPDLDSNLEDSPARDESAGSRRGSRTGGGDVKTLKSIESLNIPELHDGTDSRSLKIERAPSVNSMQSGMSLRSGMSHMGTQRSLQPLRHLHVARGPSPAMLSPIHSAMPSRSGSRMSGYASGYASIAHSAAASRRQSVVSHNGFPFQLQQELQDEFNVDHYCTPVLRLSKGLANDFGNAYGFGAHMMMQDDEDDDIDAYDDEQADVSRQGTGSHNVKRMSSESCVNSPGINSYALSTGSRSHRLSDESHQHEKSIGSNADEHNVRVLPVWIIKKKSSCAQNSKRMPSAAQSIRSYTNTMSVFEEEVQAQAEDHRFLVRPGSLNHIMWSFIGLVTIIYDCITMPLEVFDLNPSIVTNIIAWLIRIYWMVNVIVSFRTGFFTQKGTVEMSTRAIGIKYCRTWLPLDVFTIVLDWIDLLNDGKQGQIGDTARALRVLRTLRLVRLIRAPEIAALVTDHIMDNSEQVILVAHIAKIMTVMVWVVHCIACFWYGISTFDENNGWARAEGILDLSVGRQYAWSFHWSLMAFFGNTLVLPTSLGERCFTILVLILAFLVSASFVSSITTSMTRLQLISSQQSSQFAALRKYLHDHNITRPLAQRVMRNAQYAMVEMKRNAPESSIELLAICSVPLRIELHYEIHSRVILNHPFFYCYNAVNPAGMRQICHTAVSLLLLTTGDVIFTDCEVPAWPRMFFVVSGRFWYMQEGKKAKMEVEVGQWICEGVLWSFWQHRGTCLAADESQLLMVDATKFQNIVSTFHTDHANMYAAEYVKSMNKARKFHFLGLTDLADTDEYIEERIVKVFHEIDEAEEEEENNRTHSVNNQPTDGQRSEASHQTTSVKFSLFKRKKPTMDRIGTGSSSVRSTGSNSGGNSQQLRNRRISTVRRSLEFIEKLKNDTGSRDNFPAEESKEKSFSVTGSLRSLGNAALARGPFKGLGAGSKTSALEQILKVKQSSNIVPVSPTTAAKTKKKHLEAAIEEQDEQAADKGSPVVETQSDLNSVMNAVVETPSDLGNVMAETQYDILRNSLGSKESRDSGNCIEVCARDTGNSNLEVKLMSFDARSFVNTQPSKESA